MIEEYSCFLEVLLDKGLQLKIDLARHKISTRSELQKYVRSICGHRLFEVKGHPLQVRNLSCQRLLWNERHMAARTA